MFRLILMGLLAAFCISCGWLGCRLIGMEGGHWAWTAFLFNAFAALTLLFRLVLDRDAFTLYDTFRVFRRHWVFWIITGTTATGLLEAPLAYAMTHAPAWIVTATFQLTILVTPLITFPLFSRCIPMRGVGYSLLVVVGVILVQLEQATSIPLATALVGMVPVLIAAIAYSVGDQLVYEINEFGTRVLGRWKVPFITSDVVQKPAALVFLTLIGGLPAQLLLLLIVHPGWPSSGQMLTTLIVGFLAIGIGQTVFISARQKAVGIQIVGVDATIAGDVVFTTVGEIVFLSAALPSLTSWIGLALIIMGIVLYMVHREPE